MNIEKMQLGEAVVKPRQRIFCFHHSVLVGGGGGRVSDLTQTRRWSGLQRAHWGGCLPL